MADPFLLVDGYNLMHAVGMFQRRYGPGEFARWRARFLHYLSQHLTPRERERTTVVFDAPETEPGGRTHPVESHGLVVIYAQTDLDADGVLEELVAEHSAPRQILLVSSDHRLQKAARRRRGKSIDSEDFAVQLEARKEQTGRRKSPGLPQCKFTGLNSQAELSAWLEVFGEIPEIKPPKNEQRAAPESRFARLQKEIDELTRGESR